MTHCISCLFSCLCIPNSQHLSKLLYMTSKRLCGAPAHRGGWELWPPGHHDAREGRTAGMGRAGRGGWGGVRQGGAGAVCARVVWRRRSVLSGRRVSGWDNTGRCVLGFVAYWAGWVRGKQTFTKTTGTIIVYF